jgi:flagellar hook-associated protein 3 FlgL
MSGTLGNIYNNINFALQLHSEIMTHLQEQVSTGSRINRASDDPSSAYRVLGLYSQKSSLENYMDNLSGVVDVLEFCTTVIDGMTSSLTDANLRLTQVTSGIHDQQTRDRTAEGINDLLEQMILLANSRHMNQYLFGGSNTATAPYVAQQTDGEITSVTYQGSLEDRNIGVAPGIQSSAFYIGDKIFRSDNRGTPVFTGSTGAAAGTGTSSATGYVWLEVTQPGGAGNPYKLSIDGGLTTVDADGSANQAVTDSLSGKVLYVDTTAINSTGVDLVSIPGTHDIFNTLITLRDILKNKKGVSETQLEQMLNNSISSLDELNNLLLQTSVSAGSKIGFLDGLKKRLENLKFDTEDETTRLQQADIAQVAVDLSRREVLYQMSLSVAGKLLSLSLLDFID